MSAQTATDDRRLFVNGQVYEQGDWYCVLEWMAHKTLALPVEWVEMTFKTAIITDEKVDRYIAAAEAGERVRFNPPKVVHDHGEWSYQTVKGRAPLQINADVRAFFEDLTPGAEWRMSVTSLRHSGRDVESALFARVHPELGVRVVVAGCDPRVSR